ncbi:MAG: hypothetical protein UT53_C0026G0006 [Candidatus Yanofskybacteria bacterium GW2011_GWD2_39_48]|uniref:Uncharacterized protein n=1 Tax=Candidatus Yanofskybacteria bacterium GW2011_GWD2_39_48 TaxID=1619031 RepID=A0A0G0RLC8_9BACT|nr:MAG: hypothetical protein UT53_C0026G0006 [Candidatus Yanofskybacteria bacterium GW2011_GWD2_39_48]
MSAMVDLDNGLKRARTGPSLEKDTGRRHCQFGSVRMKNARTEALLVALKI